jgi:hypothetical protein
MQAHDDAFADETTVLNEPDESFTRWIEKRSFHTAGRLLRRSEEEENASARFGRVDRWSLNGRVVQLVASALFDPEQS